MPKVWAPTVKLLRLTFGCTEKPPGVKHNKESLKRTAHSEGCANKNKVSNNYRSLIHTDLFCLCKMCQPPSTKALTRVCGRNPRAQRHNRNVTVSPDVVSKTRGRNQRSKQRKHKNTVFRKVSVLHLMYSTMSTFRKKLNKNQWKREKKSKFY